MTDKMKTNVNSTFSDLSNMNSTLDLYNSTAVTVPPVVFNTTISAQLTNSETTFQTNITSKEPLWMSTTESSTVNEKYAKPVTLSQTKTPEIITKQMETLKPVMKIFPETTLEMTLSISSKKVAEEEIKSTSIFSTTSKAIFDKEIFTFPKSTSETLISTKSIPIETPLKKKDSTTYSTSLNDRTHTLSKADTSKPTTKSQLKTQPFTTTRKGETTIQINAKTTEKVIENPYRITTENTNEKQRKQVTEKISTITTEKVNKIKEKTTLKTVLHGKSKSKLTTKMSPVVHRGVQTRTTVKSQSSMSAITTEKLNKIKEKKTTLKTVLHGKSKSKLSTKMSPVVYRGVQIPTTLRSQSSMNNLYLETTTEPAHTMGAGPLVIVVLLPFLALFLIAVVTALRRKMKKSRRRIVRVQSKDMDNLPERNQNQMIPLTKPEINE